MLWCYLRKTCVFISFLERMQNSKEMCPRALGLKSREGVHRKVSASILPEDRQTNMMAHWHHIYTYTIWWLIGTRSSMSITELEIDANIDCRVVGTLASHTLCRVFRVKHVMCIPWWYELTIHQKKKNKRNTVNS